MDMEVIERHLGKKKGVQGVTVHLLIQGSNEPSKTITVNGLSVDELYEKLMFFLTTISNTESGTIKIMIEEE